MTKINTTSNSGYASNFATKKDRNKTTGKYEAESLPCPLTAISDGSLARLAGKLTNSDIPKLTLAERQLLLEIAEYGYSTDNHRAIAA